MHTRGPLSTAPSPPVRPSIVPASSSARSIDRTASDTAIATMFDLHDVRQAGFITLDDHLLIDRAMCELNGMVFDEAASIDRFGQAAPTALRDGIIGQDTFIEHVRRQTSALSEADVAATISRINAQLRRARAVVAHTDHGVLGPGMRTGSATLLASQPQPQPRYSAQTPEALETFPNARAPRTERWFAQAERQQHELAKARVLQVGFANEARDWQTQSCQETIQACPTHMRARSLSLTGTHSEPHERALCATPPGLRHRMSAL